MPDWTKSMQQTFEYFIVDPGTWEDDKRFDSVKACTISRDSEVVTLGSATFDIVDSVGECYIRAYLKTIQNGIEERFPLGTFLVQTPKSSFDGKKREISVDAYTPLLELKENPPPIGYSILKKTKVTVTNEDGTIETKNVSQKIMKNAYELVLDHARAPVVAASSDETLYYDFVANTEDTWLSFISDLISNAKYSFDLDEMGRILFTPKQDTASLQPVWTYDDSNSSILYSDISVDHDIYGIPNVVEVVYSNGLDHFNVRVVNKDPNSPISTVSRGREIIYRVTNPDMSGTPSKTQLQEYAEQLLSELSTLEYTITYTHGYCPVRLGDCVRLDYSRAGLNNIKAKVISQSIKCIPGCPVTEKAVFTKKLWG